MPWPVRLRRVRVDNGRASGCVDPFAPQSIVVIGPVRRGSRNRSTWSVALAEADTPRAGHVPDAELGVHELIENTADQPPAIATAAGWQGDPRHPLGNRRCRQPRVGGIGAMAGPPRGHSLGDRGGALLDRGIGIGHDWDLPAAASRPPCLTAPTGRRSGAPGRVRSYVLFAERSMPG